MNKYRNKKTMYNGVLYDSMKESCYARELDLRVKAKDIKAWVGDKKKLKFQIVVNGSRICTYTPDFMIVSNDNSIEYVDIKGIETTVFKIKWKLIHALYPELKFIIIK